LQRDLKGRGRTKGKMAPATEVFERNIAISFNLMGFGAGQGAA
jgi:hypothetical protein